MTPEKGSMVKKEVTSRLLDYTKEKDIKTNNDPDYIEARQKRIAQRIKVNWTKIAKVLISFKFKTFREQSRDLPNSAFKTFYGKAPFENYGYGNTNPSGGGTFYGQYMKTHNVNPHRGGNSPLSKQVYDRAEIQSAIFPPRASSLSRKRPEDLQLSDVSNVVR